MATRSRRRFDDDDFTPFTPFTLPTSAHTTAEITDLSEPDDSVDEPCWSSYPDATHGPEPTPSWVIASPGAIDTDLGVMKTGKEADVSLQRRHFARCSSLLALM